MPNAGPIWVSLAFFYVRLPSREADPENVEFRGEVLYGEGAFVTDPTRPSLYSENLGDGIHALHLTNTLDEVAAHLMKPEFEYRLTRRANGPVGLFTFGFARRPPVVGLADRNGWVRAPVDNVHRIHQFVRTDKVALLTRISGAGADREEKRRANRILDALARVAGCDLRAEHVQWLGDVLLVERERSVAWWHSAKNGGPKCCRAIDVHVRPECEGLIQVQVRVSGLDGMCILDRLVEWRDGERAPKRLDLEEEVGTVLLRTWLNGGLVQENQYALLRGFSTRVDLVSATYTIRDRLTSKLERALHSDAAAPSLLKQAQTVSPSGMSTRTGSSMNDEPWGGLNNTAQDVLDFVSPPVAGYACFSANAADRTRAVLHFADLISKARDAYLVDPWFDPIGADALISRVRGDVRLTIVTNLPTSDHAEQKSKLVDFLQSAAGLGLPSNLKVMCVHHPDTALQVFHDRVLLLRDEHRWHRAGPSRDISRWPRPDTVATGRARRTPPASPVSSAGR